MTIDKIEITTISNIDVRVTLLTNNELQEVLFYSIKDYGDEDSAVDISSLIDPLTPGVLTITPTDVGLSAFDDIYIITLKSKNIVTEVFDTGSGMTANLLKYNKYIIGLLAASSVEDCKIKMNSCKDSEDLFYLDMLINTIYETLSLGDFDTAKELVSMFKSLCECRDAICSSTEVLTGYGYKTINNTITLL